MEAREKAQELFDKYFLLTANAIDDNGSWVVVALNKSLAKQCALTAIDELIEQEKKYNNGSFYPSNYWKEVKIEIEKI